MTYPAPRDFASLARAFSDLQRDLAEKARVDAEAREEAREQRNEMKDGIAEIRRTLNGTVDIVKKIEPRVWEHEKWFQRAIGAKMAFSFQWAAIVVIVGLIGYFLRDWLPRIMKVVAIAVVLWPRPAGAAEGCLAALHSNLPMVRDAALAGRSSP